VSSNEANDGSSRRFYTLKQAAAELNIQYWLLLRAANRGLFPCYTIGNGRRRVQLAEVVEAIKRGQNLADQS
jgi:predicted site-specific integrase-resolvase